MVHLLPLLLLLLATFHATAMAKAIPGFWSIDCGSSKGFINKTNGIEWVGDKDYVKTGESRAVPNTTSLARELQTLRAFTSKKKNCYTVPVAEGTKVFVRVLFYYGNYDGLSTPPSFNLQFDANHWSWVPTTMDEAWRYEVVYVTKKNGTSICFAKMYPDQNPFVNSIEVRTLKPGVYGTMDSNHALLVRRRSAYGAYESIRYPDDPYDRIWTSRKEGFTLLKSDAPSLNESILNDEPPELAFKTAVAPSNNTSILMINTSYLSYSPVQIYFNMYFGEMSNLTDSTRRRSFNIYMDDKLITSKPIVPPYGSVLELIGFNFTASNNTMFSLVPTSSLSLPPIISAMEVFHISSELSNGTNIKDIRGLASLQEKFKVLQEWTGDPCLPKDYNWEWVNCSSEDSPRITQLHLNGYGLSGTLPDFSALDALEIIDLHNNSLDGDIPKFLGNMQMLGVLNLADNDFSGIPTSLSQNSKIRLDVSGNPKLSKSKQSSGNPPSASPEAAPSSNSIIVSMSWLYLGVSVIISMVL